MLYIIFCRETLSITVSFHSWLWSDEKVIVVMLSRLRMPPECSIRVPLVLICICYMGPKGYRSKLN